MSARAVRKPTWLQDFVAPHSNSAVSATTVTSQEISSKFSCFLAAIEPQTDPLTFQQAVKGPHWIVAMNEELDALERNKTWEVTTLPPKRKAIGSKWIL